MRQLTVWGCIFFSMSSCAPNMAGQRALALLMRQLTVWGCIFFSMSSCACRKNSPAICANRGSAVAHLLVLHP